MDKFKNGLKNKKNDGILVEAIEMGEEILLEKIQNLFNMCLFDSIIPSEWNNVLMILIYKKKKTLFMGPQMLDP